jgi:hypothetical protein
MAHPYNDDDDNGMHAIIHQQKSDGSWDWDQRLLDIIGKPALRPERRDAVVATALAVAFLQKRFAHAAGSWELIVLKATSWLSQTPGVSVETAISDAGKLLDTDNGSLIF